MDGSSSNTASEPAIRTTIARSGRFCFALAAAATNDTIGVAGLHVERINFTGGTEARRVFWPVPSCRVAEHAVKRGNAG